MQTSLVSLISPHAEPAVERAFRVDGKNAADHNVAGNSKLSNASVAAVRSAQSL